MRNMKPQRLLQSRFVNLLSYTCIYRQNTQRYNTYLAERKKGLTANPSASILKAECMLTVQDLDRTEKQPEVNWFILSVFFYTAWVETCVH